MDSVAIGKVGHASSGSKGPTTSGVKSGSLSVRLLNSQI